ncbi:MAG: class I SAM-dependent rRNA methyltransferase [Bdellovibrionales bacterium]|nr:class I SAM-dependent rRNA methyltransferase [Bdellovibrionales bacterium]
MRSSRRRAVESGHPWIFSGAVQRLEGAPTVGALVNVCAEDGTFLAAGHYGADSIAVRVLSTAPIHAPQAFLSDAISAAQAVRDSLVLREQGTNAFRLINAEGDGLPGLVIDRYDRTLVVQCHSEGMQAWKHHLREVLQGHSDVSTVVDRSPGRAPDEVSPLEFGELSEPMIDENGLQFRVNCRTGQKTGFFLDQRENRALLRRYARGRTVLNAFCYTGGFSVYALAGGAREVWSVDSSEDAVLRAEENVSCNAVGGAHRALQADCLQLLRDLPQSFDLIVLDPPAFVKQRSALRGGIKGYTSINYQALRQLPPGGLLFTFSCSAFVSFEQFRETVLASAQRAGRAVRILHRLGAAPCHPVRLTHPEGEYLKGLVLYVE